VPYNFKLPYVVTVHDLLMHKFTGKETTTLPWYKYAIKRFGYKRIFASSVKNAQKVIVPTEYVKDDLVRYYSIQPKKIVVTYEGVDVKVSKFNEAVEVLKKYDISHPFFVYAGNAYPQEFKACY
jgi:glycosyltransferase involved in cell wall biosynthesis